jgi:hypothetical protein
MNFWGVALVIFSLFLSPLCQLTRLSSFPDLSQAIQILVLPIVSFSSDARSWRCGSETLNRCYHRAEQATRNFPCPTLRSKRSKPLDILNAKLGADFLGGANAGIHPPMEKLEFCLTGSGYQNQSQWHTRREFLPFAPARYSDMYNLPVKPRF